MGEEQIDRVEIDGRQYAVTHFTADAKGGSFRALKFDSRWWVQSSKATLLPGDIPIDVCQVGPAFGDGVLSEFHFRFSRG
jgi:hypothetical protein